MIEKGKFTFPAAENAEGIIEYKVNIY